MGFSLFLFILAFLTAQECVGKSESILDGINRARNAHKVVQFAEPENSGLK